MGQIRSIAVRFGSTYPTGNYQNVSASFEMEIDLEPGDDFKKIVDAAWGVCKANVRKQVSEALARTEGKTAAEVYNGLPPEVAETLTVVRATLP
jgi:hypothetical protein